ncbi:response regulator [Massilia sp. Mn16-1_5]|uniref:response regulator n=1 Tax=Massilia sp. Mn16-1_5 TaxID=2079199 RepID=UPI00109E953B|nr:response regulator [Massilia sp. Mn16-1_5]THC44908.1 response regulator [Massilia sp. Mn16-1_5]
MKVLVVDDDVVSRMMLMHLVDSCGRYEILEAEDGADAWRQLEGGLRPAIVFCDLRMPHLSGTELLARVRAHPALAQLPFVLVSAANDAATMGEAEALGATGYVVKPFRVEGLRPHLMALESDEAPAASAQRLGIDAARLALYLGGLERQLLEAAGAIDAALAAGDTAAVSERLRRLREGCATLGLRSAATALARAEAAPQASIISRALDAAREAVAAQAALLGPRPA